MTWNGHMKPKHLTNPYYTGPVSDHFDGRVFYNPNGIPLGRLTDLLKWQFGEKRAKWPKSYDSPYHGTKPEKRLAGDALEVTLIGHATFLIQLNGLNLITDPVFAKRASPSQIAGPKRANPPGVAFDDLPAIDAVLLTHNHYDHMDMVTLKKLVARDAPLIITPLGNDTILHRSLRDVRIKTGDWGDVITLANDTRIQFEPCHHWSARGFKDRSMALWAAFVIETPAARIYHIGDTGFHGGLNYKAAAEKYGEFDLAILPIGAYAPRWFMKAQHQNPLEAVAGFKLCHAKAAIGHHWGTFQLTNEAIEAPKQALRDALKHEGIAPERFTAMHPGQVWQR
ncbi:MAG: MBL fold metallo-hydrolase [Rhodobacterales bacterium]